MTEYGKGRLLITGAVALVLFFSLLPVLFSFHGLLLRVEMLVFLALLGVSFLSLARYRQWGRLLLFVVFAFHLGNLIFIWFVSQKLFLLPLVLGLVGFITAFPRREKPSPREEAEADSTIALAKAGTTASEPHSRVIASPAKTVYSPGKIVASKFGTVYHLPKCEWANNIKKSSRLWFPSIDEAVKKGYKPHSCVQ